MALTIDAMPAYNESESVANVILDCRKYVDKVVVVDDGILDNTIELTESLSAYVDHHETNKGHGEALKNCFEIACKLEAHSMIIIDSNS
ncbi:Dolichol-phosphate mannosyltransferase [Methanosarcina horonobensis HB-1 = JCM 15518]|uniref:Dolichol-phosphate mannosyltransferase n=2 Tax=Methanosarcina horonobensis TaxID=418008 RepID=A0A0E3SFR5_9EURY|nr:glycosyltransferase [Methanosarcina horonobensis]AKB79971.1 Dolichol-phosphate mannosyltransferase [Methanosarcina horonobensis HB-1 = JCM 15518]